MPISCAVLANIALSLPVKTLTLPAIDTSEGAEQLSDISEYCHPGRLEPDCAIQPSLERAMAKAINAKTVEIASSHVAMLARPEETANLILEAAGRASRSNVGLKSA